MNSFAGGKMLIKGIQKTTLVDYPGKVASTIFLYGCNFRCPFCFSPDLVLEEKKDSTKTFAEEEILSFLSGRRKYIRGVCVTGGEPTLNSDLPVLLSKIKLLDMSVKLDTNGTNPGMLENLVRKKLVDYIAMDIKAPLEKYSTAAGVFVDREKIAQSVDFLKECGVDYEFRTTVVPALHSREDILAICHWLGHAKRYSLQQFLPAKTLDQRMAAIRPYTPQQMKELAELAGPFFDACEVKNM